MTDAAEGWPMIAMRRPIGEPECTIRRPNAISASHRTPKRQGKSMVDFWTGGSLGSGDG
jgi:hypothetical protein